MARRERADELKEAPSSGLPLEKTASPFAELFFFCGSAVIGRGVRTNHDEHCQEDGL